MEHSDHTHSHAPTLTHINRAFVVGIGLNALFVLIETAAGYYYDSLALLSDAGHNLSDVASLILALLAFKLTKKKPTATFTYGYRKTTILVSLINAMVLLIAMGAIAWESIGRINAPQVQEGGAMAVVAGVGIIINSFTAWLFFKDQEHDMNIKGAYLHLAADALVSLAVVMAGILIYYTGWYWLDTVMSLGIVVVIVIGTWGLLRDSLILTLDGVPRGVNMEKIEEKLRSYPGIEAVSHLHVWAISTTDNALTVHLTLGQGYDLAHFNSIKSRIKHDLEHLSIQHSTIEIELPGESSDACW